LSPIAINAKPVMFLSIDEYFEALTSGACTNKEDELDIRMAIWYVYNDRYRDGKTMYRNDNDESLWQQNLDALLNLISGHIVEHQILKAKTY
jgi:hypothetical protein